MKIVVFLHGTAIMHCGALGHTREERVRQVQTGEPSVCDFASYVPVGKAVSKLRRWREQGAEICYLSSHKNPVYVEQDRAVLNSYHFPTGQIFCRQPGKRYQHVAERVLPDVLIEDDCESIGGIGEMTYPHLKPEVQAKIVSIVVHEFEGLGHLTDDLFALKAYQSS
ncbi:MAG TPA: hypothetical protein VFB12_29385 [Ktedonobacteraceae bacterium]|nr:hypothetical protein [Ktedonobacteraceae bacterium]